MDLVSFNFINQIGIEKSNVYLLLKSKYIHN